MWYNHNDISAATGAREAGRGHDMVLLAVPLRLYWLLRRQKRAATIRCNRPVNIDLLKMKWIQ